jgi:isopentenyl-diphosphate delta-isomerase
MRRNPERSGRRDVTDVVERNQVVLVDGEGCALGVSDKLVAHEPPGRLHLAFSVFLFDASGRLLVQRRAATKYHFPLVWANSCCSHPQPGEELVAAAESRVAEELGLKTNLRSAGSFIYRATCPVSGFVEHEFDWVLTGALLDTPRPDPSEVAEIRLVRPDSLASVAPSEEFAPWFERALEIATQNV